MFKGKVDDWRVQRNNAYVVYCSFTKNEDRQSITDLLPLPFDKEFNKEFNEPKKIDNTDIYEEAKKAGYV